MGVGNDTAVMRLTNHGHVIEYRSPEGTLTEVATCKQAPLPVQMRIIDRRLIGYRTHMIDGLRMRYHCSYQLESVPLDIYLQLHQELEFDARTATLATVTPGSSPASPECISLMKCDLLSEGFVVHTFHTFPGNAAVLRIQTLFERLPE